MKKGVLREVVSRTTFKELLRRDEYDGNQKCQSFTNSQTKPTTHRATNTPIRLSHHKTDAFWAPSQAVLFAL